MSKKRNIIVGGIGLFVAILSVWAISAEDAPESAHATTGETTKIALLDVNKVFKKNAKFKEEMAQIKKEADEMDKKMKEEEATLRSAANQLTEMSKGSTEYSQLEAQIARSKTEWTVDVQVKRRAFLQREANIYRLTYQEVEEIAGKYARERQIDAVFRFMGDPVDSNSPDSILAEINKPIVWHNEKVDITSAIIQLIAEKQKQASKEEKEK
jgi:Skp family chaperone for outer membrane proteins